jgi:mRNA interferase RelE/StbE
MFKIDLHRNALKYLNVLPKNTAERVFFKIKDLANNPFPAGKKFKKLSGTTDEYRLRIGDYRVIYSVDFDQQIIRVRSIFHGHTGY